MGRLKLLPWIASFDSDHERVLIHLDDIEGEPGVQSLCRIVPPYDPDSPCVEGVRNRSREVIGVPPRPPSDRDAESSEGPDWRRSYIYEGFEQHRFGQVSLG